MKDSSRAAAPISKWTIFNILIGSRLRQITRKSWSGAVRSRTMRGVGTRTRISLCATPGKIGVATHCLFNSKAPAFSNSLRARDTLFVGRKEPAGRLKVVGDGG